MVGFLPPPWVEYPDADGFDEAWATLAQESGARVTLAGESVEGRPIRSYELGAPDGAPVLLTGLMHGVEVVGSIALLELVRHLVSDPKGELLRHARIVVVPVVNPDALHANCALLAAGRR